MSGIWYFTMGIYCQALYFFIAHLCVKRVHNPLSIELRAGEDIETRGNYNSRYKKYFAFLFCTRIIVSIDNSFTWNQSARRVRQIYADGLQTWEKKKEKDMKVITIERDLISIIHPGLIDTKIPFLALKLSIMKESRSSCAKYKFIHGIETFKSIIKLRNKSEEERAANICTFHHTLIKSLVMPEIWKRT